MDSIKELRAKTGLSQARFADLLGIPRRTLENWECGRVSLAPYLLALIAYWLENEGYFLISLRVAQDSRRPEKK